MKYDWQRQLQTAILETDPQRLPLNISRAEVVIKKRLLELSRVPGHDQELQAIREGLLKLEALISRMDEKDKSA